MAASVSPLTAAMRARNTRSATVSIVRAPSSSGRRLPASRNAACSRSALATSRCAAKAEPRAKRHKAYTVRIAGSGLGSLRISLHFPNRTRRSVEVGMKPSTIGISLKCGATWASSRLAALSASARRPAMLWATARKCRLWL